MQARRRATEEREATLRRTLAENRTTVERRLTGSALPIELQQVIEKKAPRLAEPSTLRALGHLAPVEFVRDPREWRPKGKGRETLYRSLCEHLLARYPMPPFIWSALFEEDAATLAPFVVHVARGGSVYGAVRDGLLPVPLTRKMCHELMQTPADVGFLKALRRVEIGAATADGRFLTAWMSAQAGRRLQPQTDEMFWLTVIEWFGRHEMVDPSQVSPLVDFIIFRRQEDVTFSLKGRSLLAMLRGMREWHDQLAQERAIHGTVFKPTGLKPLRVERRRRDLHGNPIVDVWRVQEILTSKALAEEGRVLRHCVYSYASSIENGHISIWSLNLESPEANGREKRATIEVRNDTRRVVQARGRFNCVLGPQELAIVTRWAAMNNLELHPGRT